MVEVREIRTGDVWLAELRPDDLPRTGRPTAGRRLGQVTTDELAEIRKILRYFLDL